MKFLKKYGVSLHLESIIFTKHITVYWTVPSEQYYELFDIIFMNAKTETQMKNAISKIKFVMDSNKDNLRVPFGSDALTQLTVYKNQSYLYNVWDVEVIEYFEFLEDTYDNKDVIPKLIIPTKDVLGMFMDLDYFYNTIMVKYENMV